MPFERKYSCADESGLESCANNSSKGNSVAPSVTATPFKKSLRSMRHPIPSFLSLSNLFMVSPLCSLRSKHTVRAQEKKRGRKGASDPPADLAEARTSASTTTEGFWDHRFV